jgi:hypothetical protein
METVLYLIIHPNLRRFFMKSNFPWQLAVMVSITLLTVSCKKVPPGSECDGQPHATVKVFATGLNNPRGLEIGPDGYLYVAEGGIGGTDSTVGQCEQIPAPAGPALGSPTGGRISRISPNGIRTTLTDQLPTTVNQFGNVSGVADVAFMGNDLYALITGAGCSHGVPNIPNSVIKVNYNGSWSHIADLSAYLKAHPVANPDADDFEPDGSWYSMISVGSDLYAVEANHGELDKISTNGDIKRIVDVSATQGHIVPTVVAYRDSNFYLGNLDTFPAPPGDSKIFKVNPNTGELTLWASGFNMILGLAFDKLGRLYVLENTVGAPFPTPGLGTIVRIDNYGNKQTIVTGLTLPTGLTIGPDGNLYVSANGFGPNSIGGGEVLQICVRECNSQPDYTWKKS